MGKKSFCSTISVNLNSDNRWQHSPNLPRQEKTFVLISFISLKKVLRHRPGEVPFQNEDHHENVVNPGPCVSPNPIYSCWRSGKTKNNFYAKKHFLKNFYFKADGEDPNIYSCRVESCAGWRLNKLPEVKAFIFEDLESKYSRTSFKRIPGKSPEMIFFNANDEEIERVDISKMTRKELNTFVQAKGIPTKGHDEV